MSLRDPYEVSAPALLLGVSSLLLALSLGGGGRPNPPAEPKATPAAALVAPAAERPKDASAKPTDRPEEAKPGHDQPPIIVLSEANRYSFPSGSYAIAPEFARALREEVIPRMLELAKEYGCDVLEAVGFTDEQRVRASFSNLDTRLLERLGAGAIEGGLIPASNADLGLLRAWTVSLEIRRDPSVRGVIRQFHAMSAGQAILPDGEVAAPSPHPLDDPTRRRIELRLRRSSTERREAAGPRPPEERAGPAGAPLALPDLPRIEAPSLRAVPAPIPRAVLWDPGWWSPGAGEAENHSTGSRVPSPTTDLRGTRIRIVHTGSGRWNSQRIHDRLTLLGADVDYKLVDSISTANRGGLFFRDVALLGRAQGVRDEVADIVEVTPQLYRKILPEVDMLLYVGAVDPH